jgi:ABC-2 type transport system ATP-binding protein
VDQQPDPRDDEVIIAEIVESSVLPGDTGTPGQPTASGAPGSSRVDAILDRVMSVHRPAVLAHLRGIRAKYPDEGSITVRDGVAPLIEITGGFVNDLSVRDNVYLTAGLHGMTKREIDERFDEIIEFAEIRDFVDTPYKHLSSGMKVRIAFAVISRLEEPIILVDEVLAVGDKAFREKCYTRIEELLAGGRTLFFVSHSERDLLRFCTRGLYLDKGALVLDASIGEVVDRYNADYGV